MEMFFFEPAEYERLYNCSSYSIDQIPLENRQSLLIGTIILLLGIILEILYVPCLIALRKHMDNTCYMFMFCIAITDMMCLLICGILTGYLAIIGAVFCSAPNLIYIAGALGFALWVTETTVEMFLALNRCVELCSAQIAHQMFHGFRIYLWLVFPTVYGLYAFIFTEPILFSGLHVTWFLNPHIGYRMNDGTNYRNSLQSVHDVIVITVLPGIYLIFALIMYFTKSTSFINGQSTSMVSQKKIFVQVVLISGVNAIASAIYVTMQFVPLYEFLLVTGQFLWLFAHGIPPIIYLLLNKTVRHDVYTMFVRTFATVFPRITVPSAELSDEIQPNIGTNGHAAGGISTNRVVPIAFSAAR